MKKLTFEFSKLLALVGLTGCATHPWDGDNQIIKQTTNPNYVAFENIEPYPALYNYDDSFRWSEPVNKICQPKTLGPGSGTGQGAIR